MNREHAASPTCPHCGTINRFVSSEITPIDNTNHVIALTCHQCGAIFGINPRVETIEMYKDVSDRIKKIEDKLGLEKSEE